MIKTKLCQCLGIDYPIIQGGMAWVADATLAAAVSNAGGLGLIAAMNADENWLRREIRRAKSLTSKPFGVNIMLMSPTAAMAAQVVIEEGVPVVTTGAGNPSKFMAAWLEAGIKVLPVVPSVAFAKLVCKMGATGVIAEGGEAGGHIGDLTTMVLVPQVAEITAAYDVPLVAAGGIANGRGIAAALMLGAAGVQVGTAFLVAKECGIHPNYKAKILAANDIATVTTGKSLGHPVRCLKTKFSNDYVKMENSCTDLAELEALGSGALRLAAVEGDLAKGCFMAGQSAGMVKCEAEVAAIISKMVVDAAGFLQAGAELID